MKNTRIRLLNQLTNKIDSYLWAKGFKAVELRIVTRFQILVTIFVFLAALGAGWKFPSLIWLCVSTILVTWNFYSLAQFIQHIVLDHYTKAMLVGLLVRFYGRLAITGTMIAGMIVWLEVSPIAVSAGFATLLVSVLVWGILRLDGQQR